MNETIRKLLKVVSDNVTVNPRGMAKGLLTDVVKPELMKLAAKSSTSLDDTAVGLATDKALDLADEHLPEAWKIPVPAEAAAVPVSSAAPAQG